MPKPAESTVEAVRAVLKTDPNFSAADRARKIAQFRGTGTPLAMPSVAVDTAPKIIRRKQACERYGCSLRLIDKLAQEGLLKKVKLPGRTRAVGFLESDINALLLQKAA